VKTECSCSVKRNRNRNAEAVASWHDRRWYTMLLPSRLMRHVVEIESRSCRVQREVVEEAAIWPVPYMDDVEI
jgi:hypothetical protein